MKQITSITVAALMAWLSLTLACAATGASASSVSFFADTGHQVQGDFLSYFYAHGGEAVLGKPLTEEFIAGGMTVQLFEYMVVERPLGAPASAIRLRAIGDKLGKAEPRLPASAIPQGDDATRRYFPATGHAVCPAFLSFFEANGGHAFFGEPISDIRVEKGVPVQYFQNASLQWDQKAKSVRPGPLGRLYLESLDLPESLLRPVQPPSAAQNVAQPTPCSLPEATLLPKSVSGSAQTYIPKLPMISSSSHELQVEALVKYPRTGLGGVQTLHLYVRDRNGRRLAYAQIDVIIRSAGKVQKNLTTRTDTTGRASLAFDIGSLPAGRAVIDVRASYGNSKGLAQTAFVLSR